MAETGTPPCTMHESFRVHPAFTAVLARHGLTSVDALVHHERGTPLRRLEHRENWRLDLADGGRTVTLYLKKHRTRTAWTRLLSLLRLSPPSTSARTEADWTDRLTELGVPTMTVVAYGERLRRDGTLVAAFMTEALAGHEQLDLYLARCCHNRCDPALRRLIACVADVAARFHRAGLNHRDLYSCHFFVMPLAVERPHPSGPRSGEPHDFSVRLIDLQRVQHWPALLRRRWLIKDLAQLAYSCPPDLIGPTERLRFLRQYLGVERLRARGKRLARAVLRRAAALERKHGPYRDWGAERARLSPERMAA